MARKSKLRIDRVIILILVALLVGGAIGFGVVKVLGLLNSETKQEKTTPVVTTDGIRISLNDYTIYYDDTDDLGFNFIVANINFSSNESISFDLGSLQTSEKIALNDISKYLNKMDIAGYDLKKLDVNTSGIASQENSVDVNLFIPYSTDASSLAIFNSADTSNSINLDLTKSPIAATTLKLSDTSEEIVVGNTSVYVSKAYISTFMLNNGEPIDIGSTVKYYSYEITVKEAKDNVKITDAIFIKDGTSDEIHANQYESIDMKNILNTNLSVGTTGGLFFEVYSTQDVVEDGTLLIKFSNSDTWVELSTDTE